MISTFNFEFFLPIHFMSKVNETRKAKNNLFVTSKKRNQEFSNSPIDEFKVLHKGQRAFETPF